MWTKAINCNLFSGRDVVASKVINHVWDHSLTPTRSRSPFRLFLVRFLLTSSKLFNVTFVGSELLGTIIQYTLTDTMCTVNIECIAIGTWTCDLCLARRRTELFASTIVHCAISSRCSCRWYIDTWNYNVLGGNDLIRFFDCIAADVGWDILLNDFIFVRWWTLGCRHVVMTFMLLNLIVISIGVTTFDIITIVISSFGAIVSWGLNKKISIVGRFVST